MNLRQKINDDMKAALKAGDKFRLSAIRMLLSAVKYKEVDVKRELTDEEVSSVASTLIRQRQDSIEQYKKGGRLDLAQNEAREIEIIKEYMPPQMSADEVRAVVKKLATDLGATTMKDMGKLMKAAMAEVKGRADGKLVNDMVKETLGG